MGQEVLMHLTCTNLSVDKIKEALTEVRNVTGVLGALMCLGRETESVDTMALI